MRLFEKIEQPHLSLKNYSKMSIKDNQDRIAQCCHKVFASNFDG
jgi:hypothetical protein